MATEMDTKAPPFTPECEVVYEGGKTLKELFDTCEKNPGHKMFIPVSEFTMEHLPKDCQTQEIMKCIRYRSDLTVKVVVTFTSPKRPDTFPGSDFPYPFSHLRGSYSNARYGTGEISIYVSKIVRGQRCPCPPCTNSEEPKMNYMLAVVHTARHVVYDTSEASHTVIECFNDTDSKDGVQFMYGVRLKVHAKVESDLSIMECVTHDTSLIRKLRKLSKPFIECLLPKNIGIIISHPHGCSKHITVGKDIQTVTTDSNLGYTKCYEFEKDDRCRLPNHQNLYKSSSNDDLSRSESISSHKNEEAEDQKTPQIESKKPNTPETDVLPFFENPPTSIPSIETEKPILVPGVEYSLQRGAKVFVPLNSKYLYSCPDPSNPFTVITFPPGTSYYLRDGKNVSLPEDVEFVLSDQDETFKDQYGFYAYAIATCPGSSGAKLHFGGDGIFVMKTLECFHAGAGLAGKNRTAEATY